MKPDDLFTILEVKEFILYVMSRSGKILCDSCIFEPFPYDRGEECRVCVAYNNWYPKALDYIYDE